MSNPLKIALRNYFTNFKWGVSLINRGENKKGEGAPFYKLLFEQWITFLIWIESFFIYFMRWNDFFDKISNKCQSSVKNSYLFFQYAKA